MLAGLAGSVDGHRGRRPRSLWPPPEDFTRARNARAAEAKAGGDPALASRIRDLRKPTTGAWLLNSLARDRAAEVRDVVELGARLRAAQGTLSADELRALDRRRRELTGEVVELARSLGAGKGAASRRRSSPRWSRPCARR